MSLLLDLAIVTISCLALGLASKHLRQASLPVYIIAGIILGKGGFDLITSEELIQWLGKIGIILLVFYIGLKFHYREMKERGRLFAGCVDFIVNFSIGFILGLSFGLSLLEAFILASLVFNTSSALAITILIEKKRLIYPEAETVVWIMILEDIIQVILLVVLISVMVDNPAMIPVSLAKTLLLVIFILVLMNGLKNFISPLFERDDEIPILLIFALIFGFSAVAYLLDVSVEIVAFFLGSVLSDFKPFKRHLRTTISFKNLFLTIFFFSFGMMLPINFASFPLAFIPPLLALLALSILGKFISGLIIGKKLHNSLETGLKIGAYTMPRGEFAIVLLAVALGMGVYISEMLISLAVAYVIIISLLGSFIAGHGDRIGRIMARGISKLFPNTPPETP